MHYLTQRLEPKADGDDDRSRFRTGIARTDRTCGTGALQAGPGLMGRETLMEGVRRTLSGLLLAATLAPIAAAQTADAETCEGFGIENRYLLDYFCRHAEEIIGERTRTIVPPDLSDLPEGFEPELFDIPPLGDAYRVDPKKTLELIERIRSAGGLVLQ